MQRYFVDPDSFTESTVKITGDDVFHIAKVLRAKAGEKIICCNGTGLDVLAEIISIDANQVLARILQPLEENRESNVELVLAQALPKSDKMDLIIQKGTEIGVTSFLPFTSERTVVQLNEKKEHKRIERWNKIAKEAAEQAHRSRIPELYPVLSFKDLLKVVDKQLTIIAYEHEHITNLFQVLKDRPASKKILLIIGPEGGFSEREVTEIVNRGAIAISLGTRILRTETAGIVGAANILYHLENS